MPVYCGPRTLNVISLYHTCDHTSLAGRTCRESHAVSSKMDDYGDATLHPEPAREGSQAVLKGFASDAALEVR